MRLLKTIALLAVVGSFFCISGHLSAQVLNKQNNKIQFQTFNSIYYLSNDSRGLSLLTTEEVIVADFPASGFVGITRKIPGSYQGHSVNVQILNVSDAAGNAIPYKTYKDKDDLVISTGDPDITIVGSQTIKIRYQTKGVINLDKNSDELLLNVNGRGWDSGFNNVTATLKTPKVFQAKLKGSPSCYTSLGDKNFDNCELQAEKKADETVITVRATNLAAHQALIVKTNFQKSTFTNKRPVSKIKVALVAITILATGILVYKKSKNRKINSGKHKQTD